MNEPLRILDEIERHRAFAEGQGEIRSLDACDDWQSLRAALEAQAEELAQKDARIVRLEQAAAETKYHTPRSVERLLSILNESPAQSAAAIKAAVLRDEARQWREAGEFEVERNPRKEGDRELVHFFIADQLESKADRIEAGNE